MRVVQLVVVASGPVEVGPGSDHDVVAAVHEYLDIHAEGAPEKWEGREVFSDCLDTAGIVGSCSDGRSGPSASAEEHIGSLVARWDLSRCRSSHRKDEVQR